MMDTSNGRIYEMAPAEPNESMTKFIDSLQSDGPVIPMKIPPTFAQMARKPNAKVNPDEPCGCGSGREFKCCCLLGGNRHRGEK